ncbi:MAG: hypothetical protein SFW09_17450 [Hyphomicrobiaceae bacterium]|nr:hypothetical protein [Hyphomicrobiaceae bacterium]
MRDVFIELDALDLDPRSDKASMAPPIFSLSTLPEARAAPALDIQHRGPYGAPLREERRAVVARIEVLENGGTLQTGDQQVAALAKMIGLSERILAVMAASSVAAWPACARRIRGRAERKAPCQPAGE